MKETVKTREYRSICKELGCNEGDCETCEVDIYTRPILLPGKYSETKILTVPSGIPEGTKLNEPWESTRPDKKKQE